MNRLWRVAINEYKRNVFKKSFIFTLISGPFIIACCIGIGLFIESSKERSDVVGYVDHAGVLQNLSPELQEVWSENYNKTVEFISYQDEDDAQKALKENRIQAYYLLPKDYLTTRRVSQIFIEKPGGNAERQFFDFLQLNLVNHQPQEIAVRVAFGTEVVVRSMDASRFIPDSGPTFGLMMPFFINISFLGLILLSSGYTMTAVAEEKENRTMEILITSISPFQLIAGKIIGIVAISLTMLATWSTVVWIGIITASRIGFSWFGDLSIDFRIILSTLAIAIPTYIIVTALMIAIGSVVSSTIEGNSIAGIFIFLHLAPCYLGLTFLNNPHNPLAIILSLMPFTSLMTIGVRNFFTIVPTWQVLVSVVIQTIFAILSIYFAVWAFRLGILRYGQRLRWTELLTKKGRGAS